MNLKAPVTRFWKNLVICENFHGRQPQTCVPGMEETLLTYRTKKRWTLFVTCPLNSEAILFGLDRLIGFRKEHIYASKSWEMVRILPTVARRTNISSARKGKVSCLRKNLYDSDARRTFYMYMRRGKENLWTGHHSEGYNPK